MIEAVTASSIMTALSTRMQHNNMNEDTKTKANDIKAALSFLREEARRCGLTQTDNSLSITEIIINIETNK
ncbi:hypothetical protein ACM0P6_15295 (plasmid) [Komagataeibacter sucrofermentans]|uniref:Uncharacterized protein n=1 Tax=Komagataeibacter sucrofermentans TaxID=1053551 RepID=A0A318QLF7_9PROT|nr:hypothetical protein [Komagataeibacter sucrofermentans]PYD78248.1 hypothetical protein CFR77_11960 [Komagataeibacter sucrofermentans]GBQ51476.1 hypothetical protein AA15973_2414 [Komagataeibacter sucrofermentans DSM 15973]